MDGQNRLAGCDPSDDAMMKGTQDEQNMCSSKDSNSNGLQLEAMASNLRAMASN